MTFYSKKSNQSENKTFISKEKMEGNRKNNNKAKTAAAAESLQSGPTLCDPIDGSAPGSLVPGILQARKNWSGLPFPSQQKLSNNNKFDLHLYEMVFTKNNLFAKASK